MSGTAKLFMHGRSQAVRLPKEFRFAGNEVKVSKVGDRVILEPMVSDESMPWTAIDPLGDSPFMPQGREQPEAPASSFLDHASSRSAVLQLLSASGKTGLNRKYGLGFVEGLGIQRPIEAGPL